MGSKTIYLTDEYSEGHEHAWIITLESGYDEVTYYLGGASSQPSPRNTGLDIRLKHATARDVEHDPVILSVFGLSTPRITGNWGRELRMEAMVVERHTYDAQPDFSEFDVCEYTRCPEPHRIGVPYTPTTETDRVARFASVVYGGPMSEDKFHDRFTR